MSTANDIAFPAEFRPEPDLAESYSRTVEAPAGAVTAATARLELIGPLVGALIAIGVQDHIVTPYANGLVWRFGRSDAGRVQISWAVSVAPETDDSSLVTLALEATATDPGSRDRLLDAWPVIGPLAELHARRVLHRIESLAEEAAEDPFGGPGAAPVSYLRPVS
jgi:hypothetical protein